MTHSLLQNIEWDACLLEPQHDREVELYLRRELGAVPPMAPYLAHSPWVARSVAGMNPDHALLAHTSPRLADLVGTVVSQERSCRYCYAMHRAMLRLQGFDEARIRRLEGDLLAAELDSRERAALEFSTLLSRANPRPGPAHLQALRDHGFSSDAARELAFVVASNVYFNLLATMPALSPDGLEKLPDRVLVRIFRPLVLRVIRAGSRSGQAESAPPDAVRGPYGALVAALDGLPAARAVRCALDDALSSSVVSRRTKSLVFGVIARGMGSAYIEKEASRVAADNGLTPADFDGAISHLASPAITPLEAALLAEARQTIRYRPIDVQRRARTLLERVSVPEFVEFMGTAALANAICRLALVLEPLE